MERPEAVQPERDGEAAALVESIGKLSAGLDAERLEPAALDALKHDVARLTDIAATRREASAQLQSQLQAWRDSHAEALSGAAELEGRLAALDARIGAGDMGRDRMETILGLFETALDNKSRAQETREAYNRAFAEDDLASVSSLATALQPLEAECDAAYAAIDKVFAERPRKDEASESPRPPESKIDPDAEHGTASEKSKPDDQAPDRKPDLVAGRPTDDASEPAASEKAEQQHGESGPGMQDGTPANKATVPIDTEDIPDEPVEAKVLESRDRGHEQEGAPEHDPDSPTQPPDDKKAAPLEKEDISVKRIEKEIAKAIERGRFGIAYHLALAAPEALPGANAVKLVACNYVTDERATVDADLPALATGLRQEAEAVLNSGAGQEIQPDYAVLIVSAALVPARTAAGISFWPLLSFLVPHLGDTPSLQALTKAAADASQRGIDLSVELLREDNSLENWTERVRNLRDETEKWIEKERQAKLKFQPATKVWCRILAVWEDNGRASLGFMLEKLLEEPIDSIDVNSVAVIAKHWRDHKEIDRIDHDIRGGASHKIDGAVRLNLRNKIDEAIAFFDRWSKLIDERPNKSSKSKTKEAATLRRTIQKNAERSLKEIAMLETPWARQAKELVQLYITTFESAANDVPVSPMSLNDLLNGYLLADPRIRFDAGGHLSEASIDIGFLLHLANQDELDFKNAAVERSRRGVLGAEEAIDFAERSGQLDEDNAVSARASVDREQLQIQRKFEDKARETANRLDAAYARGVLSLEIFQELRDEIPSKHSSGINNFDFSGIKEFETLRDALEWIEGEIEEAQKKKSNEIHRLLDGLESISQEDRKRIEAAIDRSRFQVAVDLIEQIESGKELAPPGIESKHPFDRFFPDFVEEYETLRSKVSDAFERVRHAVKNRECIGSIDATRLSEDAAGDGGQILNTWLELRKGRTTVDALQTLMRALGFANVQVRGSADRTTLREIVFWLEATPIADRNIAQLPDFGSRAKGWYRLLVIRDRATEEAIIREVGERSADRPSPNIVLFMNVLSPDSRCKLAREFKSGKYRPTLVLDEALIAFLAAWPGDRLGAFFDCASAFAFAQPFDPNAAEVPPEMFFGRESERNNILAMSGGDMTHLVYGGRRLGKTALLVNIEREYRTKTPDQLVFLINLKGSGIGENRPTDDLWRLFAERLAQHKIVTAQTIRHDSIGKAVKQWLDEEPARRILLLVDEADVFFEADLQPGQGYLVLEQMKRLMEETGRRFKVVFAGLHNVQRVAREPNTPFAHLGDPIPISPMLPKGKDHGEIENLIRAPLEALGYRFDSTDSIVRIAAETNYYPALAQQFCKELLRYLCESGGMHSEAGPPYTISQDTVDRVFDLKETRDRIHELFSWTIQLDPRYGFLTYLIAQLSFDKDDTRPRPIPIEDIRDRSLSEWPRGFESNSNFWMFEILLKEMVGLGILRETADKKYAIRTRNLRMLLGNDDEIKRQFRDAKRKPAPPTFDPAQFRNTLNDATPSSLTADQENRLFSRGKMVGLVFGTDLAGLNRVIESFEKAVERKEDVKIYSAVDPTSMDASLKQVSRSRKPGVHIVPIDIRGTWSSEVVNAALKFVAGQDAQNRIIRPIFLCSPSEAWEWMTGLQPERMPDVDLRDIWLEPCARDFARKWLKGREAPAHECLENLDHPVDTPWPIVVKAAADQKRPKSIADAIDIALGDGDLVSDVLVTPQIEKAIRMLSSFSPDSVTANLFSDFLRNTDHEMSREESIRFFDWADLLGLVRRDGGGYRLGSTYAKGFQAIFQE